MMVVTIGMLIGALLGMRYRVLVLIPAFGIGQAAILAIGLVYDTSLSSISATSLLFVTGLQIGYIGGGFIRASFASARPSGFQLAGGSRAAASSYRPFIETTTAGTAAPRTPGADNPM